MSRITSFKILWTRNYRVARNVCGSLFFGLAILCVLLELIFAIGTDWFFLLGINICDFQKVYPCQYPASIIFFFIEYVQQKYIFSNNKPVPVSLYTVLFLNQRQVVIEHYRHDFLALHFCVTNLSQRIFTLECTFVEKMFAVIFICGNVFLRIAGKIAKIRTRKNFVPHGSHLTYKLFSKSYLFI